MASTIMGKIMLLFVFCCTLLVQLTFQQGPDIQTRIDEFVKDLLECYNIPAATVAAVKDGEVITAKGYGVRDLDTGEQTRDRDLFVIASVTKQMVATVVGRALKKHNLTWDTPVRDILGDWFYWKDPYRTAKVNTRDTLAHRTGLPGHNALRVYNFTQRELFERIRHLDTTAAIRSRYKYNNLMYGLASFIASTLEGKPWEQLAKEIIFDPLGMNDTTFVPLSRDRWDEYVTAYSLDSSVPRVVSLEYPALFYNTITAPGGVASNAPDMSRWMMAQLSGGLDVNGRQVLDPDVIRETHEMSMPVGGGRRMWRPVHPVTFATSETYAMGFMRGYYRGYSLIHHGGVQIYLSLINMLTDMKIGVFTSVNLERFNAFGTNVHAFVMDLLLGEEPFLNSTNACPQGLYGSHGDEHRQLYEAEGYREDIEALQTTKGRGPVTGRPYNENNTVGVYTDVAYGSVTVYRNSTDDELYMSYGPFVRWLLVPRGEDLTFSGRGVEPYWKYSISLIEFKECDNQPCTRVDVRFDAERPPTFHRIPEVAPPPNPPCPYNDVMHEVFPSATEHCCD